MTPMNKHGKNFWRRPIGPSKRLSSKCFPYAFIRFIQTLAALQVFLRETNLPCQKGFPRKGFPESGIRGTNLSATHGYFVKPGTNLFASSMPQWTVDGSLGLYQDTTSSNVLHSHQFQQKFSQFFFSLWKWTWNHWNITRFYWLWARHATDK